MKSAQANIPHYSMKSAQAMTPLLYEYTSIIVVVMTMPVFLNFIIRYQADYLLKMKIFTIFRKE